MQYSTRKLHADVEGFSTHWQQSNIRVRWQGMGKDWKYASTVCRTGGTPQRSFPHQVALSLEAPPTFGWCRERFQGGHCFVACRWTSVQGTQAKGICWEHHEAILSTNQIQFLYSSGTSCCVRAVSIFRFNFLLRPPRIGHISVSQKKIFAFVFTRSISSTFMDFQSLKVVSRKAHSIILTFTRGTKNDALPSAGTSLAIGVWKSFSSINRIKLVRWTVHHQQQQRRKMMVTMKKGTNNVLTSPRWNQKQKRIHHLQACRKNNYYLTRGGNNNKKKLDILLSIFSITLLLRVTVPIKQLHQIGTQRGPPVLCWSQSCPVGMLLP